LLSEAERWIERTGGAFNPAMDAVQILYQQNPNPSETELESLRQALQAELWKLEGSRAVKLTALSLNFNSFAKGYIADCAAAAALRLESVQQVMVNLGGDLCYRGKNTLEVAIAHPFTRDDNAPAMAKISIRNQGVATSGHTQRGRHLFDPHSAKPVQRITQATVVAQNAATADLLATALCVLEPTEGLTLANTCGVGCLLVETDGTIWTNAKLEEVRI
jgi:FAD:protein FMN transferase